jgi:multidrug efflux pump subunit AcrA (membrane-fusion protein)
VTRGRRIALAAAIGIAIIVLVGVASLRAFIAPDDVPTIRVERKGFERRISAEGILTAVKATPLTPPLAAEGPLKIAWLAPDGSHVKAGDVVVRFDPTDKEKELADGRSDRDVADRKIAKKEAEDGAALRGLDRDAESARLDFEQAHTFQSKDPDIFSRV